MVVADLLNRQVSPICSEIEGDKGGSLKISESEDRRMALIQILQH